MEGGNANSIMKVNRVGSTGMGELCHVITTIGIVRDGLQLADRNLPFLFIPRLGREKLGGYSAC